jgi:hypothetical protein
MKEEESKGGIEEDEKGFCDKSKAFFFSLFFFHLVFFNTTSSHSRVPMLFLGFKSPRHNINNKNETKQHLHNGCHNKIPCKT